MAATIWREINTAKQSSSSKRWEKLTKRIPRGRNCDFGVVYLACLYYRSLESLIRFINSKYGWSALVFDRDWYEMLFDLFLVLESDPYPPGWRLLPLSLLEIAAQDKEILRQSGQIHLPTLSSIDSNEHPLNPFSLTCNFFLLLCSQISLDSRFVPRFHEIHLQRSPVFKDISPFCAESGVLLLPHDLFLSSGTHQVPLASSVHLNRTLCVSPDTQYPRHSEQLESKKEADEEILGEEDEIDINVTTGPSIKERRNSV